MKSEIKDLKNTFFQPIAILFYFLAGLLVVLYIILYQYSPIDSPVGDLLLNSIIALASLISAVMASLIYKIYDAGEYPRKIWGNIMSASWLWFLGELTWLLQLQINNEVPVPGFADVFWVAGFLFFTFALYYQYVVINPAKQETIRLYAIGIWLVVLLIPALILFRNDPFTPEYYVEFYYPFADLAVGIAGLILVLVFRGGALVRPWIGLMFFGLSDMLYAWAEKTQLYMISSEMGDPLSLFIDITYLAAYLILSIGYLGQWLLLRYGWQPVRK